MPETRLYNPKMVRVAQLNCHKSAAVSTVLTNDILKGSDILALLQEPPVSQGRLIPPGPSFHAIACEKNRDSPRAAIYATADLPLWKCPMYTGRDMVTAVLKQGHSNIYFASIYLDITHNTADFFPQELIKLLRKCRAKSLPLVLGIDSNAHSLLWGPDSNSRGEVVESSWHNGTSPS